MGPGLAVEGDPGPTGSVRLTPSNGRTYHPPDDERAFAPLCAGAFVCLLRSTPTGIPEA